MNPLGFALENFDAVGRYREKERDKPIDASGSYETRSGNMVKFAGAKELANSWRTARRRSTRSRSRRSTTS